MTGDLLPAASGVIALEHIYAWLAATGVIALSYICAWLAHV